MLQALTENYAHGAMACMFPVKRLNLNTAIACDFLSTWSCNGTKSYKSNFFLQFKSHDAVPEPAQSLRW